MEALSQISITSLTSATHLSFPTRNYPLTPLPATRISFRSSRFRSLIPAKQSYFQDFQGYARPSRLLPAADIKDWTDSSVEKIFTSLKDDPSWSLFKVDIGTSKIYGSNLSDLNAGVLLCLIDENSDSILQRIPASLMTNHSRAMEAVVDPATIYFQRGSVDEFVFKGPKLGRIEAVWIGLESGQWRLSNLSLAVVSGCVLIPKEANGGEHTYIGLEYNFQMEDTLLGEGSGNSIVELRPSLVTNLSTVDPFTFLSKSLPRSSSPINVQMSNEESMKAYADLKFSMLLYDAMLVFTGTSVLFSASENAAFAFFIGGMGGFLYLLLLQRSVDGLPAAPSLNSRNVVDREEPFGRFKNPVSSLSLAAAFALLTLKYGLGDSPLAFTPKELVMGMLGFLSCKVAVVLAAWKPMPFHKAKK